MISVTNFETYKTYKCKDASSALVRFLAEYRKYPTMVSIMVNSKQEAISVCTEFVANFTGSSGYSQYGQSAGYQLRFLSYLYAESKRMVETGYSNFHDNAEFQDQVYPFCLG